MALTGDECLEATQWTLAEHLDEPLESATDETTVLHLRHAKQLAVDLPTLVDAKGGDEFADVADEATN